MCGLSGRRNEREMEEAEEEEMSEEGVSLNWEMKMNLFFLMAIEALLIMTPCGQRRR